MPLVHTNPFVGHGFAEAHFSTWQFLQGKCKEDNVCNPGTKSKSYTYTVWSLGQCFIKSYWQLCYNTVIHVNSTWQALVTKHTSQLLSNDKKTGGQDVVTIVAWICSLCSWCIRHPWLTMSSVWGRPSSGIALKTRASWLPFSAVSCPSPVSSQCLEERCSAEIICKIARIVSYPPTENMEMFATGIMKQNVCTLPLWKCIMFKTHYTVIDIRTNLSSNLGYLEFTFLFLHARCHYEANVTLKGRRAAAGV